MQPLLTRLLNLPGVDVEDYYDFDDQLILDVEAHTDRAICPRCHQESSHLHQNHPYFVRDLNISDRPVMLRVNRRQFKCLSCGKPFSETLSFVGKRRKQTDRFCKAIVKQLIHSDAHNVAINNGLTDEEVAAIVKYVAKKT